MNEKYLDPALSPHDRAKDLITRLTIREKLAQLTCIFPRDSQESAGLLNDFPDSAGHVSGLEMRQATDLSQLAAFQRTLQKRVISASRFGIPAIFHMEALCGPYIPGGISLPSGLGRASSWNPRLEQELGIIVGQQERAVGVTYSLAPVLDVARDPRMGRQGETYGEDPTLVARMGVSFMKGLQNQDERPCPSGRTTESVAKHFMGFHAGSGGVHGTHAEISVSQLREVYGTPFQAAINSGLRGIMPCYNTLNGQVASSSRWLLTEVLREQMGFEGVAASDYGAIGNMYLFQGQAESFADAGLMALEAGMDVEWHVVQGFNEELRQRFEDSTADIEILDRAVKRVLEAKFRMGLFEHPYACESIDLVRPFEVDRQRKLTLESARDSLVLLKNTGILPIQSPKKIAVIGPHAANARFFFGGYTHLSMVEGLRAANSSMAGITTSNDEMITPDDTIPGTQIQSDVSSIFDEILTQQKPGCRSLFEELRERLPQAAITWSQGYEIAGESQDLHDEALRDATQADLVVMTVGGKYGTSSIATTGEGIDSSTINLPPTQETFIEKLADISTPVVLVHLDGRPLSSDAADRYANAIIEAWAPGECGAEAIVDVITGDCNPSGKLPVSIARNSGQIPIYYNHPHGSMWHQGDSIGFTDYVDLPHTPRYHFGFGLSYTQFQYEELCVDSKEIRGDQCIRMSFSVRNTGSRAGVEIAQIYISDVFASRVRPVMQLVGFARVHLEAGESRQIDVEIPASVCAFVGAEDAWVVEEGQVDVLVGGASCDIQLKDSVYISSTVQTNDRDRKMWAEVVVRGDDHIE
ncbi:glycoside hydrolase family 3 N-terminal domain-containing protein [Schaalia sp. ZJ1691]|uniref:glycoside hydrolase family 3 N-terminal domain-containing protein n=1 Tax=Schaalia sp. ZJ1691 TaxID=2709404 RepID=UPI0013EBB100|nr:glycoside hydrolase family 3 N-terminal domain-containing protein [Schaalia sp. ZJ1691]